MTDRATAQLTRLDRAITDRLQACRAALENKFDPFPRAALLDLIEAVDDIRTLAKLIPLATQEIREDVARERAAEAAKEG